MNSRTRKSGTSVRWSLVALTAVVSLMVFGFSQASAKELEKTAAGLPTEGKIEPFLGEPKFDMQQVFKDERLPNVLVTLDGTVLAFWGCSNVWVRRSKDGGQTWGEPVEPPVKIFSKSSRGEAWLLTGMSTEPSACGQITSTPWGNSLTTSERAVVNPVACCIRVRALPEKA